MSKDKFNKSLPIRSSFLSITENIEQADIHFGTNHLTFKDIHEFYSKGIHHYIDIRAQFLFEELDFSRRFFKQIPLFKEDPAAFWKKTKPDSYELYYFNSSSKKDMILDLLAQKLSKNDDYSKRTNDIVTLADELMLNALFHAPVNDKGERLFSNLPRDQRISYDKDQRDSYLFIEFYKHSLVLGCIDFFGSLKFVDFLNKTKTTTDKLEFGMGIGGQMIWEKSTTLMLGVLPQNYTMVACRIPSSSTQSDLIKNHKNFHLFQVEEQI